MITNATHKCGMLTVKSIPKFLYVRSPVLLKACRCICCQVCGADDGTVVAAHSNSALHGKGRSIKASDVYVAALCYECHREVDQGRQSGEMRQLIWQSAHIKTVETLQRVGLWPKNIPIPQGVEIDA